MTLKQLRKKFTQRKYQEDGKVLGHRLNDYVGHKAHNNNIKKLVEKYLTRTLRKRTKWNKNKYVTELSNSPVLVNANEEKKLKGQLYKRRPMNQTLSNKLRQIFNKNTNEYNAWRPGVHHNKHERYEESAFQNPYVHFESSENYDKIMKDLENAIKREKIKKRNHSCNRKIYCGHSKGEFFFSQLPKNTRNKLQYDDEALFSITDCNSAEKISQELLKLKGITDDSTITDMTSCVGGNVISFLQYFNHVNAIELDIERFKMLQNNVNLACNKGKAHFYQGNGIDIVKTLSQDIIFVDPPWGGLNYKEKEKVSLFLSDDSGKEYNLGDLVIELLKYSKYFAIKVPKNFDIDEFKKIIKKGKRKVIKSITNIRKMHLYIIA